MRAKLDSFPVCLMELDTRDMPMTAADRLWFAGQLESLLPDLYGRALRLCGEPADAEDLVADATARAWEALQTLDDRARLRAWIFRILNNLYISGLRTAHARAEHESLDAAGEGGFSLFERLHPPILLWWGNPELDFLNRLLRADLARAIARLPDAYRAVVVLVDVQGFAYREVAELLDVPVGTVRSRLSRGRAQLQAELWEHAVEAGLAEPQSNDDETRQS